MKKKNLLALLLILVMCFSLGACGSSENTSDNSVEQEVEEEKHPLVGIWKTKWILSDGDTISRDDMIEAGGYLYFDIVVNDDLSYLTVLGDGYESISGLVSVMESEKGDVYLFQNALVAGMIDPEDSNNLILSGEDVVEGYDFVLEKVSSVSSSDFSTSDSTSSNSTSSDFTNEYGTKNTKCAVSGCDNNIASSGDTNCCASHSNNCLECGKYIDGDATYCMDCLSGAVGGSSKSSSSKSSSSSSGCGYKYSDGSVCGLSTNKYDSLCDYHFEQLNDTYNSFAN